MSAFDATLYTHNNTLNFTWRDFDGQLGVKKTPGTLHDFFARLEETA